MLSWTTSGPPHRHFFTQPVSHQAQVNHYQQSTIAIIASITRLTSFNSFTSFTKVHYYFTRLFSFSSFTGFAMQDQKVLSNFTWLASFTSFLCRSLHMSQTILVYQCHHDHDCIWPLFYHSQAFPLKQRHQYLDQYHCIFCDRHLPSLYLYLTPV